jgi:hypothetical protein
MTAVRAPDNGIMAAALAYAAQGWRVTPVHPGGKMPMGEEWQRKATTDEGQIGAWWERHPNANVGIVCDRCFGFVLDIDDLGALQYLPALPATLESRTPSGGRHLVFKHPAEVTINNSSAKLLGWLKSRGYAPGQRKVDVRGAGGQIVVEPSFTAAGRYAWVDPSVPIADAPAELIAALQYDPPRAKLEVVRPLPGEIGRYERKVAEERAAELARAPEGQRGTMLFSSAARLGEVGLSQSDTEGFLLPSCEQNGLVKKDGVKHVLHELVRGWSKGNADMKPRPPRAPQAPPHPNETWEPPMTQVPDQAPEQAAPTKARRASGGAPRIKFPRRTDNGAPYPHIENTEALLAGYGVEVAFNLMTHEAEHRFRDGFNVAGECQRNASEAQVREWANEHRIYQAARFADQMTIVIARKAYHPVADWIRSQPWDGIDRIAELFNSLTIEPKFLAKHERHARRILQAWLVTAAKAAMLPANAPDGIASQGVLVLQGPQGKYKTRWLMSLAPAGLGWTKEGVLLDPTNRDSKQQATDAWIVELGELDGTFRKSDAAHLKGFLTSRKDTYRKAYAKTHEAIARRTVFVGSVNEKWFLVDDTGNRRYWIIPVVEANPNHGVDLQQLWAQAAHIGTESPELGWLSQDEGATLAIANKAFEVMDPVADDVFRCFEIDRSDEPANFLTYQDIRQAIRPFGTWSRAETIALGRTLERLEVPEGDPGHEGARRFALRRRIQ